MNAIVLLARRVSDICGIAAALAAFGLIGVNIVEVGARYVLRSPTLWAYDMAYMFNGAAFVLACALTLKLNQHVSVDILSQTFSVRTQRIIEVLVFAILVLPAIGLLSYAAWGETWKAWVTGEIEQVSPWQPKIWPFRLVLAIGLTALWLQVLGRVLQPHSPGDTIH